MIYIKTRDTDIYYLNIWDKYVDSNTNRYAMQLKNQFEKKEKLEKFVEFGYEDYRITDLLNTIRDNDYIYIDDKKQTIQNALIKADITTIWIGNNDLKYGFFKEDEEERYNYMDTLLLDIDHLLTEIQNYTKEEIFFIGYTTKEEDEKKFVEYLNNKVDKLCKEKNISFIQIDLFKPDNLHNEISSSILEKFTFS